jgi:uncharacterized lipoprotein YddW (UPF0748 family)
MGESVWLVKANQSAPHVSERNYAASVCRRLSRWLNDVEIEHRLVGDDATQDAIPKNVAVVVLCYNPLPTEGQLAALTRFTAAGGKLIVFYSSSEPLAELMGFKLGAYQADKPGGRWSDMRFKKGLIPHVPLRIRQNSANIRSLRPVSKSAKVLASWHTRKGQITPDPAWLMSDKGLWMSHVLLDDQDAAKKTLMLLAMIGKYDPSVWAGAASRQMHLAGALREGMTMADSVAKIRAIAPSARRGMVNQSLDVAVSAYGELKELYNAGEYGQVAARGHDVRRRLMEAYSSAQTPSLPEIRGVWDHKGTGLFPGDWDRTCRLLSEYGMTDVFINAMWPGVGHYPSQRLSRSEEFTIYGDQISQCQKAARTHRLNIHVWKVCWKLLRSSEGLINGLGKQGRLQVTDRGVRLNWLCPTHPDNREMELASIREVAKRYRPAGIHLDYIRYPDSHACYCNGCRERFSAYTGETYAGWPRPVKQGLLAQKYAAWRTDQITSFVRKCRAEIRKVSRNIKLSAAVYGKYPSCVPSVGQDWAQWLKEDLVDYVCPMNYTEDMRLFRTYIDGQLALAGGVSTQVIPGIGVTAAESQLDAVQTIDQIRIARRAGAGGFVLFDLCGELERDVLPLLVRGVTGPEVNR